MKYIRQFVIILLRTWQFVFNLRVVTILVCSLNSLTSIVLFVVEARRISMEPLKRS